MQDFNRAAVRCGSTPDLTVRPLMSAFTGCGHNANSGFVSTVPRYASSKQRDYVMTLADHPATDEPHRRPKAHKAPGGRAPYGTEVQDDERHSDMPLFQDYFFEVP